MLGVSVIICCYNSSERITATLQALQEQVFSIPLDWEVILVDNACTDDTAVVAQRCWQTAPVVPLKIVWEKNPGLMNARIAGMENARHDIISFIDDDNRIEREWIQKVYNIFRLHPNVGACGGRSLPQFSSIPPEWFPLFQHSYAVGRQSRRSGIVEARMGHLWGAGLSIRKRLWKILRANGYVCLTLGREGKNLLSGDDTELCYAIRLLGFDLYYDDKLVLYHQMPAARLEFSYLQRMNVGFGRSNVRLNCYRALLERKGFHYNWQRELAFAMRALVFCKIKAPFLSEEKRLTRRVQASYWQGTIIQLLSDRNRIPGFIVYLERVFIKANKRINDPSRADF